jgi:hypothetical protein
MVLLSTYSQSWGSGPNYAEALSYHINFNSLLSNQHNISHCIAVSCWECY